eukprot:1144609-Pelagomonas_calceolata.AAC.3
MKNSQEAQKEDGPDSKSLSWGPGPISNKNESIFKKVVETHLPLLTSFEQPKPTHQAHVCPELFLNGCAFQAQGKTA